LIRTKVVQTMYSYMLTRPECTLDKALKDLDACLSKTYELYHYLMRLPVELTQVQEMRLDEARNKYLPSEEDLHPNMKFVNNRMLPCWPAMNCWRTLPRSTPSPGTMTPSLSG
ncbi:MAG: hypothetical protein IJ879_07015, partial [Muribaculaceae bacterium]|nr:hypothetical protein [Muribaculaceae bacterium]